jgi:hypothetical protein
MKNVSGTEQSSSDQRGGHRSTEQVGFTPGPWSVVLRGSRGTFYIPEAHRHESTAADSDGVDGSTVSGANARLIASAPCMYAALKEIIAITDADLASGQGFEMSDAAKHCYGKVTALIAKAEGRQS